MPSEWICSVLSSNSEWTASDQCIKIHFDPLAMQVNMRNDWSFIHEQKPSVFSPLPPLSDPTETPAPPSRLHKLYNVQCRNKVDHLRAICLFSYLAKFSFHLPPPLSHSLSRTGFPLNFYDHSRREWRTAGTTMIENGDGDIGIPLTFANYTPKIDSPVVHIEKFSRDSTNLRGGIAIESHGLIASLSHKCWRYLGAERRENRSEPRMERTVSHETK